MVTQVTSPRSPSKQLSPVLPSLDQLHISEPPNNGKRQIADDELERFRSEWRQEVKSRKGPETTATAGPTAVSKHPEQSSEGSAKAGAEINGAVPTTAPEAAPKAPAAKARSPVRSTRTLPASTLDLDVSSKPGASSSSKHAAAPPVSINKGAGPGAGPSSTKASARTTRGVNDKDRAVQMYTKAVESEQSGKLNEALMLYRKAFKLDGECRLAYNCYVAQRHSPHELRADEAVIDDVDRLYTRSIAKATAIAQTSKENEDELAPGPTSADVVSSSAPVEEPYSFQRHIQTQPDYERAHPPATIATSNDATSSLPSSSSPAAAPAVPRPSILTSMLAELPIHPQELAFLPAEEELPIPIAQLPAELLDPILAHLDVTSIERFASTCWRARYLTHISNAWRHIAQGIYKPPAMIQPGLTVRDLANKHHGEWRTTLVEEERVRMDGCYISVCHYIRPGAGEQWVTITHMITYHRFLRFYPDGSCISFLTTDHPSEVVPILRPSLRGKGLHLGRWRLVRSDSIDADPESNLDATGTTGKQGGANGGGNGNANGKGKGRARIEITELLEPGMGEPKYEFEMELSLRETGRGKWNKLDIIDYRSINLVNEEALSLSLRHQKPFYFSKVKSYNPPF